METTEKLSTGRTMKMGGKSQEDKEKGSLKGSERSDERRTNVVRLEPPEVKSSSDSGVQKLVSGMKNYQFT